MIEATKPCIEYSNTFGSHNADRVFFPARGDKSAYREAAKLCAECPDAVVASCLAEEFDQATNLSNITGYRARMTPKERTRLFRRERNPSSV